MNTLRAASYNIRKCVGLDARRAPGRIVDVINSIGADVIALQEADKRLGRRPAALPHAMIESHSDFHALPLDDHGISLGFHGNAVLVRKDVNATALHRFNLPGMEPRGAVAADLSTGMRVVALHLGLMRRHRHAQLNAIREALETLSPMPTLLMGDFNEWSPTRGLDALDGFDIHAPGRSFHAARPLAALDRIAITSEMELRDAGVVETVTSRRASDHLPIWADLRLSEPAPASLAG